MLQNSFLCSVTFISVAKIGRLSTKDAVLFLCDMQEKFRPNIFQFPNIVSNAARMLQVGHPDSLTYTAVLVTEVYQPQVISCQ